MQVVGWPLQDSGRRAWGCVKWIRENAGTRKKNVFAQESNYFTIKLNYRVSSGDAHRETLCYSGGWSKKVVSSRCGASAGVCEVIGNLRQRVRAPAGVLLPMWWPQGTMQSRNWIGSDSCWRGFSYEPMHERDRHSHSVSWSSCQCRAGVAKQK